METELRMFEEGPQVNIHPDGQHLKNIKRENPWPKWHIWILVKKIHLHPRQTCYRNE